MAKRDLDYLKKKYGKLGWNGKNYQDLVQLILKNNSKQVASNMLNISNKRVDDHIAKLKGNKPKQVLFPNFKEIMTDDLLTKKSAEGGKIITNTLRDKLIQDLNDTIREVQTSAQRGRYAGKVNDKLVEVFEQKLRETYAGYTKKDKKTGIPPNIKTIAVTEIMSTSNEMRHGYIDQLKKKNPKLVFTKTWIHNKKSKVPRHEHLKLHGKTIPNDQNFTYKNPKTNKTVVMKHPHDSSLGATLEDIAGCRCSIRYDMQLKK